MHSDMLSEIKELNLLYLLLIQRLLRENRAEGMARVGIPERLADLLGGLSLAQTARLAASNQLLCRFRFDARAMLGSLADKGNPAAVLAAQPAGQLG